MTGQSKYSIVAEQNVLILVLMAQFVTIAMFPPVIKHSLFLIILGVDGAVILNLLHMGILFLL